MTNGSTSSTIMSSYSSKESMKSPRKATIELIRQFARTCIKLNDMNLEIMMAN